MSDKGNYFTKLGIESKYMSNNKKIAYTISIISSIIMIYSSLEGVIRLSLKEEPSSWRIAISGTTFIIFLFFFCLGFIYFVKDIREEQRKKVQDNDIQR